MKIEFNDLKELFAFNIRYYRFVKKISQQSLAELCDLGTRAMTDIECGKSIPNILKWEKIAEALNIEPFQLLQNPIRDKDIVYKMQNNRQYNQNEN